MTSSHDRVIRGAEVQGVVFCSPNGKLEDQAALEQREQEQLKTLEDFWYSKGLQEGKQAGFDEGYAEGEREGHRKGSQEGHRLGNEEGYTQGLEEGKAQGKEEAEGALKEQVILAETIAKKLSETQAELTDHSKSEIISFTMRVAETLLRRELRQPEVIRDLVERLVDQALPVIQESVAHIYLHPEDLQSLRAAIEQVELKPQYQEVIAFHEDGALCRGDCRLEAPMGLLNFDIGRQLETLEHRLLEVKTTDSEAEE